MQRATRLRLGLWVGLVLAGLGLGYAVAVPSDEPAGLAGDGVLFPPDHAVLLSGSFDVISNGDQSPLEVDGKPHDWEPFQPPLRVAHLRLSPGVHELRIGQRRREFVVALNEQEHDGPDDWAIHRSHEMNGTEERCADCHQTAKQDGRITVGELKPYDACFDCHKPVDFDVTHSHPLQPIQYCQICHALHASTRPGLLRAPAKKLCAECHDA